jgi:hypothetical protein
LPLCDPAGGGVYVLDHPLSPSGLPAMAPQSLAPLEGYCGDSILGLLSTDPSVRDATLFGLQSTGPYPSPFLSTFSGLAASAYPSIPPLLNPQANVTVLSPNFETAALDVLQYAGVSRNNVFDFEQVLTALYLGHIIPGGYCPDAFENGMTVDTVAGKISNKNYSLYMEQDNEDKNVVHIKLLYGESDTAEFDARYLGQACFSTIYTLDSFITPWNSPVVNTSEAKLPYKYISDLPKIKNEDELLRVQNICQTMPPLPSTPNTTESSQLSTGAVAGIVVACCIIVIAFIGLTWWLYRSKSRGELKKSGTSREPIPKPSTDEYDEFDGFSSVGAGTANSQRLSEIMSFTDDSFEPVRDELILSESEVTVDKDPETGDPIMLGQGRFGKVFQGTLLGTEPIAIKCILGENLHHQAQLPSPKSTEDSKAGKSGSGTALDMKSKSSLGIMSNDQVLREIAVLKSCHSRYIVSFLGAVFLPGEVRLVTELLPAGDLWRSLGRGSAKLVTWYRGGLFIAMDVAAGLKYLHEKKRVIHLDLKSSNILLRESRGFDRSIPSGYSVTHRAKISDVGLSKMLPISHEYIAPFEAGGTWNWCAPEVILCAKCTPAADMFSFGVVLWEICTGEIPVRGRMRDVTVPEECPQEVADLIHNCLDCSEGRQPKDRPTASEAFEILQGLLQT